ncbi:peptidoglycan DD-metalloendopeptidase family protein [Terrabacter sp. NPDC000476]|uniref:M23 family metallopeptidase n=1 Tax=Terrabacter sp. NPDC000476 TaxID=3154258 RepID=UPI0033223A59
MDLGTVLLGAVLALSPAVLSPAVLSPAVPSPAVLEGSDLARVEAAAPARAGPWAWPLEPAPVVVRAFDPPEHRWSAGHRGVDLAASVGQPVLAPADGRIGWVGRVAGRDVVVLVHAGGRRSSLEPASGAPPVGTVVAQARPVGVVTSTPGHCAPRTCLHWGVRRGEVYVDPLALLRRAPVVLLPLG